MTTDLDWDFVETHPGFQDQVDRIHLHIIDLVAERCDDPDAYLGWVLSVVQHPVQLTVDGAVVEFFHVATDRWIVPIGSFEPHAEITAVTTADLDEMPETD